MQHVSWMKNPTVREIARAAGCSPATVSRALADSPLLRAATREKIREAARQLGWSPNPLSSIYMAHLRSTRALSYRATLAYLIPYADPALYREYFQRHWEGAQQRAESLGYHLEKIWLRDFDFDVARLEKFLRHSGMPGLIVCGDGLEARLFDDFDWSAFSAASWACPLRHPALHHAAFHHMQGFQLLLSNLRDYGYSRIAMIISQDNDSFSDHVLLSAFSYLEKTPRPGEWIQSYPLASWHSNAGERRKIAAWLKKHRPQIVIGETVSWEAIEELGWKVPEDIAFVSPNWSQAWSHIAGVDHMPEVIGANTVDLVVAQLTHNERGIPLHPKLILNEGFWKEGPSVPSLPRAQAPSPSKRRSRTEA